jgi:hypothetical protein
MNIVIQCAARKHPDAKTFLVADGSRVVFVARPDLAPRQAGAIHVRPDDVAWDGQSWRTKLLAYNADPQANPRGFLPAYRLYAHDIYRGLTEKFGAKNVFILSAGWGLISATFLTPYYDITFSASADPWKRRHRDDAYEDFCLMREDGEEIVFLGGKDYLPLFCRLTESVRARKMVFFNSVDRPELPDGFTPLRFRTSIRINWHYECARALIAGKIGGFC